ncbi:transglycosylase SLT domain-containing protein [Nocardia sp. CDC153]|uniref:aggregation-promoting factor C-terminal-like domain-containing protein n=1 Tax=Nocardia sp. CDC153 TaxID=3112167 RepID=UPI002DBB3632|nr:transglycosylase SLT domain-containing protein [Nocardia sp. CDC153]MEC3951427.1 transglycosylase SLT domain-containing protein [Nocardia sp. CDC153]
MPAFPDSKKPPLRAALLGLLVAAIAPLTVATGSADARTDIANPIADAASIGVALPVNPSELIELIGTAQRYTKPALQTVARFIVPGDQWDSFNQIITHESNWEVFAINPTSGAYGLAQALPAHKMFSEGPDWMFNPLTQLRWAYRYMVQRYGSPNAAWDFWQAHNWY